MDSECFFCCGGCCSSGFVSLWQAALDVTLLRGQRLLCYFTLLKESSIEGLSDIYCINPATMLGHRILLPMDTGYCFASEYGLPSGRPVVTSHTSNLCGMRRISTFHPLSRDMRLYGLIANTRARDVMLFCCYTSAIPVSRR